MPYDYWIARYPVTQGQYQAFVEATGYKACYRDYDWAMPYNWQDGEPPAKRRNHPVVLVSWDEAMAYCEWLTAWMQGEAQNQIRQEQDRPEREAFWQGLAEGRMVVGLPSEAEWEKAARGGLEIPHSPVIRTPIQEQEQIDGTKQVPLSLQAHPKPQQRYPWGDWEAESPSRPANIDKTQRGQTMSVGSFLGGVSMLSGNVWEWAHSLYEAYPYRAGDGREDEESRDSRVLRGGGWVDTRRDARVGS